MLTLYNFPLSPCGEKVRYALLEKGLEFHERSIDLTAKENLEPWYLALHPRGLVPALQHGDETIVESTVILEYLEDRFPTRSLRPPNPALAARMRLWTKLVDERLHPLWPGLAWPILVRPRWLALPTEKQEALFAAMPDAIKREKQRRMLRDGMGTPEFHEAVTGFARILDETEDALETSPWLAGPALSLADLAMLPYLFAASLFGLAPFIWAGRPRLRGWYGALAGRDTFGGDLSGLYAPEALAVVRANAAELVGRDNDLALALERGAWADLQAMA